MRRSIQELLVWLAILTGPRFVHADPLPADGEPEAAEAEPEAAGAEPEAAESAPARVWEHYPRPDESSGIARREDASGASDFMAAMFFVPRVAFEIINAPVEGAVYVFDRYHLLHHYQEIFFNDAGTFGIYPVISFAAGFGFTGGARLVHTRLTDAEESLSLEATYGAQRRNAALAIDSGKRLGSTLVAAGYAEYEVRPSQRFFGIGNLDEVDLVDVTAPQDPLARQAAIASRFRQEDIVAGGSLSLNLSPIVATLASAFEDKEFARPEDPRGDADIGAAYDVSRLPGFTEGVRQVYTELDLALDTRRNATRFMTGTIPGAGFLAAGRLGYNVSISDQPSFWRYGFEAQQFFDLYRGTRLLGIRVLGEGVSGEISEVPFVNLPRMGGSLLLRGYDWDRFRDRTLMLGTAEYWWSLANTVSASLFVDAGRVQDRFADLAFDDLRVGYGFGLSLHKNEAYLANVHVASSIDGGFFVNFIFEPVIEARVRRF